MDRPFSWDRQLKIAHYCSDAQRKSKYSFLTALTKDLISCSYTHPADGRGGVGGSQLANPLPIKYESVLLRLNMVSLGLTQLPWGECSIFQGLPRPTSSANTAARGGGWENLTELPGSSGVRSPSVCCPPSPRWHPFKVPLSASLGTDCHPHWCCW